jgi:ribosome maturation factor RimP
MERSSEGGILHETVAPLVEGLGFAIVELAGKQVKRTFHVNLVIHRSEGIDIADCTKVYKTVFPRLEVALDAPDLHLEVSSPGVYRRIKDAREFAIFGGSKVKLLTDDHPDWLTGIIVGTDDETVEIDVDGSRRTVGFREIKKAQLDYP